MLADLADVFSVGGEFEELRGGGGEGGAGGIAARKNEDVAFRIDGDADDLAEIEVGRKFQEIGDGAEMEFGRLLGEKRSGQKEKQNKDGAFHGILPRHFAEHHTRVCGISRLSEICIGVRSGGRRRGAPGEQGENRRRPCWI